MSGVQIMVVAIVAMALVASIIRARIAQGGRRAGEGAGAGGAEDARLREEVAELKKRLAVLERITVEKENSLERQIEALRDR